MNDYECRYFFDEAAVIVPIYGIGELPIGITTIILNNDFPHNYSIK